LCFGQCIMKHSVAASWLGPILGGGNHCFNVWTFISFSLLRMSFLHMIHPTFQHSTVSFWQRETERDYLEGIQSRPRGCLGDRSLMLLRGQDPLEGELKRGTMVLAFFMPTYDVLSFPDCDFICGIFYAIDNDSRDSVLAGVEARRACAEKTCNAMCVPSRSSRYLFSVASEISVSHLFPSTMNSHSTSVLINRHVERHVWRCSLDCHCTLVLTHEFHKLIVKFLLRPRRAYTYTDTVTKTWVFNMCIHVSSNIPSCPGLLRDGKKSINSVIS